MKGSQGLPAIVLLEASDSSLFVFNPEPGSKKPHDNLHRIERS